MRTVAVSDSSASRASDFGSRALTEVYKMRATVLLILAMLLPASPVWAQATERTVYANVVDKNDAPVSGLGVGEFIVREDDQAREVLRVSAGHRTDADCGAGRHEPGDGRAHARRAQRAPRLLQADGRQARDRAHRPWRAPHDTLRLHARCRRASRKRSDRSSRARAAAPTFSTRSSRPRTDCSGGKPRARTSSSTPPRVPSSASGIISR